MISTQRQLEATALKFGLLPFFSNNIAGFSVEEMAAPGKLFGDEDGCWEWKGPVIQQMTTAYGKFFRRKAGFVSTELYSDFINYRRAAYPLEADSIEATLLDIINNQEAATAAELREIIFGRPNGKRKAADPVEGFRYVKPRRQALESPLQKLQMGGRLLIADFQYKMSRQGEKYGWGVALYTTPEIWFGREITRSNHTPEESLNILIDHLSNRLPCASRSQIIKLLE